MYIIDAVFCFFHVLQQVMDLENKYDKFKNIACTFLTAFCFFSCFATGYGFGDYATEPIIRDIALGTIGSLILFLVLASWRPRLASNIFVNICIIYWLLFSNWLAVWCTDLSDYKCIDGNQCARIHTIFKECAI